MDVVDLLILALRLAFVVLLYLFLLVVLRMAIGGLRAPVGGRPSAPLERLRLLVVEPGESALSSGQILEVGDGMILGRGGRADLVLGDPAISAEHARVSRAGRAWSVTDLGSTNGTLVNDTPVDGRKQLAEGDELVLGTVRLRVLPRSA